MLDRVYLEITNLCNLDCTFCHKTARARRTMTAEEFDLLTDKLRGKAKYLLSPDGRAYPASAPAAVHCFGAGEGIFALGHHERLAPCKARA